MWFESISWSCIRLTVGSVLRCRSCCVICQRVTHHLNILAKQKTKCRLHLIPKEYFLMSHAFSTKRWLNVWEDSQNCLISQIEIKQTTISFVTRIRVYMDFHIVNGLSSKSVNKIHGKIHVKSQIDFHVLKKYEGNHRMILYKYICTALSSIIHPFVGQWQTHRYHFIWKLNIRSSWR